MAATVVKRDGIRKRSFPQSSTKHTLSSPYFLQWPSLKCGSSKKILDEIARTLGPFQFEQLCTTVTRKARKDKEQERAEKFKQRSSLVIGINQVTKGLEKGNLKLVLVDRTIQPAALLEHLLVLCATRKVPACAITGMDDPTFPPLLGVRRVAAFAFKNTDTSTTFDALVDFITNKVQPLYIPWLHSRKEEESPAATNHGSSSAEGDYPDEEHLLGIQDMENKKRRIEEDSIGVKSDTVNVQDAGDSAVNLKGTSNSGINLPETDNSAVNLPDTNKFAENLVGTSDSAVNVPGTCVDSSTKAQATDNSTVNSQGIVNSQITGDAIVNKPGGKKKRKRSRKSSKTNQNNMGLVYLRPCVKSFDVGKDKGNQAK